MKVNPDCPKAGGLPLNRPTPSSLDRRNLITMAIAAPLVAAGGRAFADSAPLSPAPQPETRDLNELHRAALAEGGKLVVYSGGDIPNASAALEKAFTDRFPGTSIK